MYDRSKSKLLFTWGDKNENVFKKRRWVLSELFPCYHIWAQSFISKLLPAIDYLVMPILHPSSPNSFRKFMTLGKKH